MKVYVTMVTYRRTLFRHGIRKDALGDAMFDANKHLINQIDQHFSGSHDQDSDFYVMRAFSWT